MLQQPSEFIMYQALPLDLNMHTPDVSSLPPEFKELGLHLQAQRAAATQAFFFDTSTYFAKAMVPQAMLPGGPAIQGMYDLPFQAVYHVQQQQPQFPLHQLFRHPQQLPRQHHHHHLQAQHASSMASSGQSVGLWQQHQHQESRGSWFPNRRDALHGLADGKDGPQEKQSMAPSTQPIPRIARQGVIVAPSVAGAVEAKEPLVAIAGATVSDKETQPLHPHSDAVQALDPCVLASTCAGHEVCQLPYPAAEVNEQRNEIQSPLTQPASTATVSMGTNTVASHRPEDFGSAQLDEASPSSSYSATALLPYSTPEPGKGKEINLVSCTYLKDPRSSPAIDAIADRYITQSPSWLPQGWITEVQTRQRGVTAGTRDKYYREPGSGRRFRSRNEVINFLRTGRGRLRKKRRKKAHLYSGFEGHQNLLSHQPHSLAQDATASPCLFLAPQPIRFVLGPPVRSHQGDVTLNVPPASSSGAEIETPCQTPCRTLVTPPTKSSMPGNMLGLKQPGEGRPQKLPVYRKEKTHSPKKFEDRQASRLWQWLQKPVAKTMEQPQNQDTDGQVKQNEKHADYSVKEPGIAERTSNLGKEIEAAQKTVMRLDKKMQATFEKLTREIQTTQKHLRQTNCGPDDAMSNVIQAIERLNAAMSTVTKSTQNLVSSMDVAVQAAQLCKSDAQKCQGALRGGVEGPKQDDGAMIQLVSRSHAFQAVEWPDLPPGNPPHATKQPAIGVREGPSSVVAMVHLASDRGCASQAIQRPDLSMGYFLQGQQMPEGVMVYTTDLGRGHMAQPLQMQSVTIPGMQNPVDLTCNSARVPQNPFAVMNSAWTQVIMPRIDVATGRFNAPDASVLSVGEQSAGIHPYWKDLEMNRNTVEARRLITDLKRDFKLGSSSRVLDLRVLDPSLSSRQRAKAVQKMKAKRARALLVLLGRNVCLKALRKTAARML